jgi:two-component system chemotaxis response regulator CheB
MAVVSSAGGPQALMTLFAALKGCHRNIPVFVTQHMPALFTTILAQHLSHAGDCPCKEGSDHLPVKEGETYIAPGNFHMTVKKHATSAVIHLNQNAPENFCRPSADPMLRSVSEVYGPGLLAVVLTGMGSDGLEGAKAVVKNGGYVIAQDEASSVVWGMPRAVAEHGLCYCVLPLMDIAPAIARVISYAP